MQYITNDVYVEQSRSKCADIDTIIDEIATSVDRLAHCMSETKATQILPKYQHH